MALAWCGPGHGAAAGLGGQPRRGSAERDRPARPSLDYCGVAASPAVSTAGPGVPSTPVSGTTAWGAVASDDAGVRRRRVVAAAGADVRRGAAARVRFSAAAGAAAARVRRPLAGVAAGAAAARFRLPLTGAGAVVARRRAGAAGAAGAAGVVLRLRVPAAVAVVEAAVRRPRAAVDVTFGVDVARGRPVAAVARRAVAGRPAVAAVVRRARPRGGTVDDAALRAAAFSLAFASCASSFAALATSRSFRRRSCAISFATAATCFRRVASAPAPALRVGRVALVRALPVAELRGVRPGVAADMRRVLVRAIWNPPSAH